MSDAHDQPAHAASHTPAHDEPHEGPIKTPKQLIAAVVFAFVIPIIVIILLAQFVALGGTDGAGADTMSEQAVAMRLQPVGMIEIKSMSDPASLKSGEQVYQAQCSACHATGAAGAPKFDDAGAWGPRVGQGYEALLTSALKGKGNMGPQGGGDFSDFEVGRAVVYLANHGGAKFAEPAAPAASAASAADETASAASAAL